jgi:TRAP-type mannitol/chloroaromatic compound transport system substrate-binding protein
VIDQPKLPSTTSKSSFFAAGEIMPGLAVAAAVERGTVEMCHTAPYYYFDEDPTFAFGTSVPVHLMS